MKTEHKTEEKNRGHKTEETEQRTQDPETKKKMFLQKIENDSNNGE